MDSEELTTHQAAALLVEEAETPEEFAEEVEAEAQSEPEQTPEDVASEEETTSEEEIEAKDDEAEDTAEEETEEKDEQLYTISVQGEEMEVTESELLYGYMRNRDYTQSKQKLAEDRRAFEQERTETRSQLKDALAYYSMPATKQPQPQDFASEPDPNAAFAAAYSKWQQDSQSQAQAEQLLTAIQQEEERKAIEARDAKLMEEIPEWADEQVRASDIKEMVALAVEKGFTPEQVAMTHEPGLIQILRLAVRGAAVEAKPVLLKRSTEVKPRLSGGPKERRDPQAEAYARAKARFEKTGSMEDAIRLQALSG